MVAELIVIVILMIAGCFVLLRLYDLFENEIIRAVLIVGYGLSTIALLVYWLIQHIDQILSNFI